MQIEAKDTDIDCPEAIHPIVRTHPGTGKRCLFVNRTFTTKSTNYQKMKVNLLELLFQQGEHIDHQIRFRWEGMIWRFGQSLLHASCYLGLLARGKKRAQSYD